jgi:hypothetical protein
MKYNHNRIQTSLLLAIGLATAVSAQDRDRDRFRDEDRDRLTRIEPGTTIAVRTNQFINSDHRDNRVYYGTVTQDVRGGNGRLAIPRGSQVEMIVRTARDNDLILDLESVTIAVLRYGIQTDANRVESERRDDSLVGSILGALNGDQANGRRVRIRQGTILTFRLERPLVVGVSDRGDTRDGGHYHDYYDRH